MKLNIVDLNGKVSGNLEMSVESSKDVQEKSHLLYLVNKYQHASLRQGSANCKTRGEVRGGGRKPYKQKGTGGARRGSNRTPLRVGGGVVFGPKPRSFAIELNKSVLKQGIQVALDAKSESSYVLQNSVTFDKTKSFTDFLKKVNIPTQEKILVITSEDEESLAKAAGNMSNVDITTASFIPVSAVMSAKYIVYTELGAKALQEWFGND